MTVLGVLHRAHGPFQVMGNGTIDGVRTGVPTESRLIHLTRKRDVTRSKEIRHPTEGMDESRTRMRVRPLTRRTSLQPRIRVNPRLQVHQQIPNELRRVMSVTVWADTMVQHAWRPFWPDLIDASSIWAGMPKISSLICWSAWMESLVKFCGTLRLAPRSRAPFSYCEIGLATLTSRRGSVPS